MPSGCTSASCAAEALADLDNRGFHRRVRVVPLLVCLQPHDHSRVLALELIAEAPTGERGVDRPAGEDRGDRLSSGRGRAPHPALSLSAIEILGETQRGIDVREQPRRTELRRDRALLQVVRMRGDQGHDRFPGSSMPEPVAANQGRQRNAASRTLLRVGERRCPEACARGIRTLFEDLRKAENARLRAGAVGLKRLRVAQEVGKPLADRPGHLRRHLTRPGRELTGDRSQNLIPGAPLPAV